MGKISLAYRIKNKLKSPALTLDWLVMKFCSTWMSDIPYLKIRFRLNNGYRLNLNNPQTLCEKIQWLKLYDRKQEYINMVDKYAVKKIISESIGEEYIVKPIGVWNKAEDIEWEKLPNEFVLKCTHDSGSVIICRNKAELDKANTVYRLNNSLKNNFYYCEREWPYKDVQPRIVAEPYISGLGNKDSVEYKITCMDGEVKFVTVCGGIAHSKYEDRTNDHFTKEWKRLDWYANYKPSGKVIEKPSYMDQMISLSEKLSANIPYVRVDWYVLDGKLIFGEYTFFTWGGFMKIHPFEWDKKLGSWLRLPNKAQLTAENAE